MNYCLQMCNVLGLDPIEVINEKMNLTEKKYPVEKAKGVSTKYKNITSYRRVMIDDSKIYK